MQKNGCGAAENEIGAKLADQDAEAGIIRRDVYEVDNDTDCVSLILYIIFYDQSRVLVPSQHLPPLQPSQ
jgi:hypothetical protein